MARESFAIGNVRVRPGSARALELVINDVLDYSRIESADLRFDSAPLSPRQLLEQVVEMRRPAARAKTAVLPHARRPAAGRAAARAAARGR